VTETVTTIEHASITPAPQEVLVSGKSSEQRNKEGMVVQTTTVITEQTVTTTLGKQVITIVETTTIDDVKPDEVILDSPAITAEKEVTPAPVKEEPPATVEVDKEVPATS